MKHACKQAQGLCLEFPVGFTLLEMSIVLVIIAVIIAGSISIGSSMVESARRVSTNNKLDAIETALMSYRLTNNRLPCPTDPALTDIPANSATYGYETGTAGACGGGSTVSYTVPSPSSNTNIADTGTVVEGAVPVKTLGLPDEFQFDSWGRKFAYAVWTPLTAKATSASSPAAFLNYGITPSCGAITVKNAGHGNRSTAVAYALVSYGSDGHGGYLKGGTIMNAGVSNADELTNCHCTNTAAAGAYAATYVQKAISLDSASDAVNPFNHFVRFKDRWQMQDAYDTYSPTGSPCSLGFIVNGANVWDFSGYSVAVGDVNGDGIPDLIIGAKQATVSGNSVSGAVFVVFGTQSGFPDPLPLNSLNGSNGFELGAPPFSNSGTSVAVGDVNGDGIADLIIGAPFAYGTYTGAVYVVFGGATRKDGTAWSSCPASCTLKGGVGNFLNGTNGAEFDGTGGFYDAGASVAAGDVNGDGIADLIIGAYGATISGHMNTGSVYVVFGKKSGWPSSAQPLNAAFLNGTNGAEFDGTALNDYTGWAVAAGDVNGNGTADLIIGAMGATISGKVSAGKVCVVFGRTSGWPSSAQPLNAAFLNGTNGVEFDNTNSGFAGWSVAIGDLNGDGIKDLIIGAWAATAGGSFAAGRTFVYFGKKSGWPTTPYSLDGL